MAADKLPPYDPPSGESATFQVRGSQARRAGASLLPDGEWRPGDGWWQTVAGGIQRRHVGTNVWRRRSGANRRTPWRSAWGSL